MVEGKKPVLVYAEFPPAVLMCIDDALLRMICGQVVANESMGMGLHAYYDIHLCTVIKICSTVGDCADAGSGAL